MRGAAQMAVSATAPTAAYAKVTRDRARPNRRAARTGSSTQRLVAIEAPIVASRMEHLSRVVSAWSVT